ncbi:MAG: exosortase C-terminal domain/associated protein EpsI [Candidatus Methylomirabilales bacterium]
MTLRRHSFLISAALLVIAGGIAFSIARGSDVVLAKVNLDQLPRRILGVEGRDDRFDESVYRVLNADYHVLREYRGAADPAVWLYIGYYGTAKGGRPSHVPEVCYTGQGFSIVEWTKVPAPDGFDGMLNKMHVKRGNVHQLVLFWYQSKDKVLADGIEQNLHRFKHRLLYNRDDSAFVRLSTSMSPDNEAEALARLQDFAGELLRLLPANWPEERPGSSVESGESSVQSGAPRVLIAQLSTLDARLSAGRSLLIADCCD